MRIWMVPLAFFVLSCGKSTVKTTSTNVPAATAEKTEFDDFGSTASTNGQRAILTSRRDAGAYRTYLYDEAKTPKLFALSQTIPLGADEQELFSAMDSDGAWILTWRSSPSKTYLLLNSFDGSQQAQVLTTGSKVRDLAMAPAGQLVFAFTSRSNNADMVKIYSFTNATSPVLTEEANLKGESQAQFALSGSSLFVYTRLTQTDGSKTLKVRMRNSSGIWSEQESSLNIAASDTSLPSVASSKGLFYAGKLTSPRQRTKLGTYAERPDSYVPNVGVIDELKQFASLGVSPFDFSIASYRAEEPLALIDVSATLDADYLLLTGSDSYYCKTSTFGAHTLTLVRVSDGKVLPLFVKRDSGTVAWTGLMTQPCDYYDQAEIAKTQDFDTVISKAKLLSVVGTKVQILYETRITGDREVRRVSFDFGDWTSRNLSQIEFTDISQNPIVQ
ncbi:MAG: hypothetical protein NTX25_06690 [Proteobacteria bacterium]|nr:hypothetical protein [Pseudomonadota bacterium]